MSFAEKHSSNNNVGTKQGRAIAQQLQERTVPSSTIDEEWKDTITADLLHRGMQNDDADRVREMITYKTGGGFHEIGIQNPYQAQIPFQPFKHPSSLDIYTAFIDDLVAQSKKHGTFDAGYIFNGVTTSSSADHEQPYFTKASWETDYNPRPQEIGLGMRARNIGDLTSAINAVLKNPEDKIDVSKYESRSVA